MIIDGYSSIRERMRSPVGGPSGEDAAAGTSLAGQKTLFPGEDTVSISEKALALAAERRAEKAATRNEDGASGKNPANQGPLDGLLDDFDVEALGAIGDAIEAVSGSRETPTRPDGAKQNMDAIQKQIEAAQAELEKASQQLQKAQTEARADPAVVAETESEDVKNAQILVTEINGRLLQLQEQMNRALRDAYGMSPGGGGCIQGTRAGSTGVGELKSHIGESRDPYAAARAAEREELGIFDPGSGPADSGASNSGAGGGEPAPAPGE